MSSSIDECYKDISNSDQTTFKCIDEKVKCEVNVREIEKTNGSLFMGFKEDQSQLLSYLP
ncbi:hypothetical protein CR513_62152, partial [Mucuna pruriens]